MKINFRLFYQLNSFCLRILKPNIFVWTYPSLLVISSIWKVQLIEIKWINFSFQREDKVVKKGNWKLDFDCFLIIQVQVMFWQCFCYSFYTLVTTVLLVKQISSKDIKSPIWVKRTIARAARLGIFKSFDNQVLIRYVE